MCKFLGIFYLVMSVLLFSSQQPEQSQQTINQVQNIVKEEPTQLDRKLTGVSSQAVAEVWKEFHAKTRIEDTLEDQWNKFFKPKLDDLHILLTEVENPVDRNSAAFSLIVQKTREKKLENSK